jgi:hypothetical protein
VRHALLAALFLGGATTSSVHAAGSACAVRLRDAATVLAGAARLETVLQVLPEPALELRAVRAAAPAIVVHKAASTAAACAAAVRAPGPGPGQALGDWYVLRFADAAALAAALAVLTAHPAIAAAEPLRDLALCEALEARPAAAAGDVEVPPNIVQVRAPEALAQVVADSSLVVAIVDTGADLHHPDLVRRLWLRDDPPGNARSGDDARDQNGDGVVEAWERDDDDDNGYVDDERGWDFTDAPGKDTVGDGLGRDADPSDEHGHGTHVAGILAADGSLRGVAPFVRVLPLRAAYTTRFGGGLLETDDAAAAIVYAVDAGARILNLSWGDTEASALLRDAIAYAVRRGVLVIAAAGNGGSSAAHFPSSDPGVVAVAAVDGSGAPSSFSNYGADIEIAAPGEVAAGPEGGILSLALGGGRSRRRGTSMATPHVAGAAAILMCRPERPDAAAVRARLVAGARRAGSQAWTPHLGHGVLDVLEAVRTADDFVLQVHGPRPPFHDDRLTLVGTLLGGDVRRWRAEARPESGPALELAPWRSTLVVADTLVHARMDGAAEGRWEWVVAAETGAGRRHEAHGGFVVDRSPPTLDTLVASAAWRGAEPRWLLDVQADEPVRVVVEHGAGDTLLLADAGLARRVQIEAAALSGTGTQWRARLFDAAGVERDTSFTAPAVLAAWQGEVALTRLDSTDAFRPEPVWGAAPDGEMVVWGSGLGAGGATTLQAWAVRQGRLVRRLDTRRSGRPIAFEDVDADGSRDLLVQVGSEIEWLVGGHADSLPRLSLAGPRFERALGLFQLDADPGYETLLSSRDTLVVFEDAGLGPPQRGQTLVNPSQLGFNVWGADAAAGDLDGDGRLEIACGDAEGVLTVFERSTVAGFEVSWTADAGGVYAYDLTALAPNGFLVGLQRSRSVTGDGAPTARYEFTPWLPEGGGYVAAEPLAFLAPENDLGAGSVAARSPATGATWLGLVRGADLYLLRHDGRRWTPVVHGPGAAREAPVLADLDGDTVLDVVLRTPRGARLLQLDEGRRAPHALAAESLGRAALRLTWSAGSSGRSRLRRGRDDVWATLVETDSTSWVDSTVAAGVDYAYEVVGLETGEPRGISNRVVARAQALPRLLEAASLGPSGVRVLCSNPLAGSAREPHRWRVGGGTTRLQVLQVTLAAQDREAQLLLDAAPECGAELVVAADGLRDDQGGRLEAGSDLVEVRFPACPLEPFAVREARFDSNSVLLEFTRSPDDSALDPARYDLRLDGRSIAVEAVRRAPGARLRLVPSAAVELVGRGLPFVLRLGAGLRAAGDGAALAHPEIEYRLYLAGRGTPSLFVWPNPTRPGDREIVFAEAAADTRVRIYDLEGQLVRELDGGVGGGLRWDLRDAAGVRLPAGVYLYTAQDAGGARRGRLVLVR